MELTALRLLRSGFALDEAAVPPQLMPRNAGLERSGEWPRFVLVRPKRIIGRCVGTDPLI
jgi:hypothetical protein